METPRLRRPGSGDVTAAAIAQAVGLAVAFFCYWIALFGLPAEGLFSERNDAGVRLVGAIAALAGAGGLSAGCWVLWWRSRNPVPLVLGVAIVAGCAVVAIGWAFQLNLG